MYTITEGLAELKTIEKRLDKKREFTKNYLTRVDGLKDPFAKDGGSPTVISKERQAISDLEKRHVRIRTAIQQVNQQTEVVICGLSKTIAEWLTWRKEVAPDQQNYLSSMRLSIMAVRQQAQRAGVTLVAASAESMKPTDVVVNVDEAELASESEKLEEILGTLDGQLSLKNATVTINVD